MADENNFVSFVCASCRQELEVPRDKIGQTVECPSCGARFVVARRNGLHRHAGAAGRNEVPHDPHRTGGHLSPVPCLRPS